MSSLPAKRRLMPKEETFLDADVSMKGLTVARDSQQAPRFYLPGTNVFVPDQCFVQAASSDYVFLRPDTRVSSIELLGRTQSLLDDMSGSSETNGLVPLFATKDEDVKKRVRNRRRSNRQVPRPRNAFILYRTEMQRKLKRVLSSLSNPEISIIVGRMWKIAAEDTRHHYARMAEEEAKHHAAQYPDYRYTPLKRVQRVSADFEDDVLVHTRNSRNRHKHEQARRPAALLASSSITSIETEITNSLNPKLQLSATSDYEMGSSYIDLASMNDILRKQFTWGQERARKFTMKEVCNVILRSLNDDLSRTLDQACPINLFDALYEAAPLIDRQAGGKDADCLLELCDLGEFKLGQSGLSTEQSLFNDLEIDSLGQSLDAPTESLGDILSLFSGHNKTGQSNDEKTYIESGDQGSGFTSYGSTPNFAAGAFFEDVAWNDRARTENVEDLSVGENTFAISCSSESLQSVSSFDYNIDSPLSSLSTEVITPFAEIDTETARIDTLYGHTVDQEHLQHIAPQWKGIYELPQAIFDFSF
ncbi:hypothetical protein BZG36_02289 [Bifiguratus adelaidae]|uniref:HMG box domain-containing protein n=1 Tax=Bifiguratus adelaidae TaxID=1938954 RepID=A0A261Y3Q5_9FUNG|nr:hypothetical protein BZG36_02289 [Bifiguratus adelaidae]